MTVNRKGIEQSAVSAEHLGSLLRYHRERAGLSRRALSELCGASETAIYDAQGSKVMARL